MRAFQVAVVIGVVSLAATAALAAPIPAFPTEQLAQTHCPNDTVVYGENKSGGVYHFKGSRWYGNLKYGMYVCKAEADAGGWQPAKNNQ